MQYTQFLIFEVCPECNLGDAHRRCPNKHPERYRGGDCTRPMSDEMIAQAADDAHEMGFRGCIGFHYYNEPLLAKERIFRLIALIRARVPGAKFVLWTNGTLIPTDPGELKALSVFDRAWVTNYDRGDYTRIKTVIPKSTIVSWGLDNRAGPPLKTDNRKPCCRIFSEMVFDYFGNVHLCCIDWRGDEKLGNLHRENFPQLWARFAAARFAISHDPMLPDAPQVCLRCTGRHPAISELVPEIARDARAAIPMLRKAARAEARAHRAPLQPGVVFVAYRLPEERVRDHFAWNDALYRAAGARVFVVVDKEVDGLPGYVRQLVYSDPMPVFSLAKTKNRGIRHAIESGCGVIVATDSDIMWTPEAWEKSLAVEADRAVVPVYRMASDATCASFVSAPKATGTVSMAADDWRKVHFHEGCEGYGSDDGILLRAAIKSGIKIDRKVSDIWHIAHVAGTPQKEFDKATPRVDHWGRGENFNPENFGHNRQFMNAPVYASPTWGLSAGAQDITFVMVHYRMPEQRLLDCIEWNRAEWERIGARVIVVSDRDSSPGLPEWVRVAKYPVALKKFNLAKTSNFGIRLAGSGIICKTDPDIYFPPEAIDRIAGVTDALGLAPVLRMAPSREGANEANSYAWSASKGVMALTWDHWQAFRGYDERMEGYGIEDGEAFHRAGVKLRPARDVLRNCHVYHIAHTEAVQSRGNTRQDCWGRASGFNPKNHIPNQRQMTVKRWDSLEWGKV